MDKKEYKYKQFRLELLQKDHQIQQLKENNKKLRIENKAYRRIIKVNKDELALINKLKEDIKNTGKYFNVQIAYMEEMLDYIEGEKK